MMIFIIQYAIPDTKHHIILFREWIIMKLHI